MLETNLNSWWRVFEHPNMIEHASECSGYDAWSILEWYMIDFRNFEHFLQKCSRDDIFRQLVRPLFLSQSIFKWHQSMHCRIPQGVVMDLKPVRDKTHNKTNPTNQFFGRQAPDSKGGLLRRESNCPGIALSENEAKLQFITLRAIYDSNRRRSQLTASGARTWRHP